MPVEWTIWDLDGTLSDSVWREKFLTRPEKEWTSYHEKLTHDMPYDDMVSLYHEISGRKAIITGRPGKYLELTLQWLAAAGLKADLVCFRPEDNFLSEHKLKLELAWIAGLAPDVVRFVFDDRDVCVKAWRDAGFRCLQVREGTY